eukprot:Lankesteria_metandrocarpae@DN3681_c0_g1_i2.p1
MDETYDVVICGTGLKECIISGLLAGHGKKVLHVDRNGYYGGDSASLNLTNLYEKFGKGSPPEALGANRDWNVDLIPKFVMACGKLVKILLHTKVTRYLSWRVVDGTFVYQHQKGGFFAAEKFIHKVPATEVEVLKSPLMGMLEKKRCGNFFAFCQNFDEEKASSHKGFHSHSTTMKEVYDYYALGENTRDFIGHAVALFPTDEYMNGPMVDALEKMRLYLYSINRYGKSPFIYPVYGLGGLPEGFARMSAVNGGTYMLNKPIDGFVYGSDGKICGVKAKDGEVAKCKFAVCDPSYVLDGADKEKVKKIGEVVRCICILTNPLPSTHDRPSCQIIIPQKQVGRQHDIYITCVSSSHGVSKQGFFVALVSTVVETSDPLKEIEVGLDLLGPIEEKFIEISPMYEPTTDGIEEQLFISKSYDASSHFESASDDVLRIWKNIIGEELDLTIKADPEDLENDGC